MPPQRSRDYLLIIPRYTHSHGNHPIESREVHKLHAALNICFVAEVRALWRCHPGRRLSLSRMYSTARESSTLELWVDDPDPVLRSDVCTQ